MNVTKDSVDEKLFHQAVYHRLHEVAEHALSREAPGHFLEPTLLANDAYLRLLQQRNINPADHTAMLAAGVRIIRRLLIDYSRKRKAIKRGGSERSRISLGGLHSKDNKQLEYLELHDLLSKFAKHHPRCARVVCLRFFEGLTSQEIADEICISVRTVKSDWKFAKDWIRNELRAP